MLRSGSLVTARAEAKAQMLPRGFVAGLALGVFHRPARHAMFGAMRRGGHDLQVFGAVVERIVVDMVYVFVGTQRPADHLFGHDAMFKRPSSILADLDHNVMQPTTSILQAFCADGFTPQRSRLFQISHARVFRALFPLLATMTGDTLRVAFESAILVIGRHVAAASALTQPQLGWV